MVSVSVISDIVQAVFVVLITIWIFREIQNYKTEYKARIEYENEFLDLHHEVIRRQEQNTEETIPLTLQHQDTEHLAHVCHQYGKKYFLAYACSRYFKESREPTIETHFLHFKMVSRTPTRMKIQVVRCAETYALVDAGDGRSGYGLAVDWQLNDETHLVWYIRTKFKYNEATPEVTLQGIEMASNRGPVQ